MVVDESQCDAFSSSCNVWGDRSRKRIWWNMDSDYQAAMDNRPLKFEEFEAMQKTKYVSGYPADYELQKNRGCRCRTSNSSYRILDPVIEIRPSLNQIDDLIEETYTRIR
jgi:excinuclease ABC subunit B